MTVSKSIELTQLDLDQVWYAGYTDKGSLYVRLEDADEPYFVVIDGTRIRPQENLATLQKALDTSEANDKLDEIISEAGNDD